MTADMSNIFISAPGRLTALKSNNPRGLIFSIGLTKGAGIVTDLQTQQQVAAQFQQSLDRAIYVVPFGDAIGSLQATLLLNNDCNGTDTAGEFIKQYAGNRLSPSTTAPSRLIIGSTPFIGFTTGFTLQASASNGHNVIGTLSFAAWLAESK
jgi:hypothetical protein